MGVLSGIRVVDFTRVVAGPYCTMLLGDLGAEIIKIEQPGKGDDTRSWGPPFVGGESAYFLSVNRNKKSVCLDLNNEDDLKVVHRLVAESDVMIENFRSGIMERFGLGYEDWRERHPRLIYCSISGYGRSGPYKDRAGYDVIVSAMGGLMGITGTPEGEPVKTGVALTDVITGLYAFSAIQTALYHRERSGQGQRLDVSLLSAELAALINAASNYLVSGEVPQPQGSAHGSIVPYQAFRAADGYIVIGAANDKLFQKLCQALAHPEWASDERFRTNAERVKNREALISLIEDALQAESVATWEPLLAQAGIAVGPVNRMDQVFQDPQVMHSQQVVSLAHPTAGDVRLVGPAVNYSLTPAEITSPPPLLGEHTQEIIQSYRDPSQPGNN
ncbi:CaiB/BaiF CoA transferase family protein [Ktedonobacter racemifer]|uniref:L-carnitine dehydratase/bile acid-inducible protein F n=1 Tax=Ktedonobacter racemifer DSM 44963 TaxID=485913 RepID=D6U4R1_KTERA|nr:L-carnitine dehydratase/bile acid-inducible protein F [Ktedonobacter racemifer DSM 44963]